MWSSWSLRAKIVGLTIAVVLPVLTASTALTVRVSRTALEDDARTSGLTLARELAASAASRRWLADAGLLQGEIGSMVGRGSIVHNVTVYAADAQGLSIRASGGKGRPPEPSDEVAAREGQEVVALKEEAQTRAWRVTVPIWEGTRSVGAVSLTLPLGRSEALAQRLEQQAIWLGMTTVILLVGSLSLFLSRALATPLGQLLQVMTRAEGGDLTVRAPGGRGDEVGQVARALNRMLDRVAAFQAELAHRVAEATTKLRTTNERLYAAQQQLGRNERLAAAGELAAAMAHNVGTPLTGVLGHLQLLEEEVADPTLKERLRRIQGQVDRAVGAARHFLDAARPAAVRVPVELSPLLADLLVLTSPESQRKGIIVESALAADLPAISGDPSQLQELFLNLLTNALDAMGSGGRLQVTTEAARTPDGDATVRAMVHDTGAGIPAEILQRVFDPFFTTRSASGGTGLGLAIARRIARDHGGAIGLESEPGHGTRVTVEFPIKTD